MANIATEIRPAHATDLRLAPAIVAAVVLVIFAVVPWRHHGPQRVVASLELVKRPPVIVPMELYAPPAMGALERLAELFRPALPAAAGVIQPPEHPDAQVWPRGMVIHPPAFPDRMAIDGPGVLDRLLSGLLAPWTAITS